MSSRPTRSMTERTYAALLRLYPRDFRGEFGAELVSFVRERHRLARRRGTAGLLALWARLLQDLLTSAAREHVDQWRRGPRLRPPVSSPTFLKRDSMLRDALSDLRFGSRLLRRSPAFTAIAVLVLALGTGAVTTMFSVANAVALRPLPGVANPAELVEVQRVQAEGSGSLSASYPYARRLNESARSMVGIAAWTSVQLTIGTDGAAQRGVGDLVTGNYFSLLGVRPAIGRFFVAEEDRVPGAAPVAVVSHLFWSLTLGADSGAVGRTLRINGHPFTVIGVASPTFRGLFLPIHTDVWLPMMMQAQVRGTTDLLSSGGSAWLSLFGRRRAGSDLAAVSGELAAITSRFAGTDEPAEFRRFTGVRVTRLSGLPADASGPITGFMLVLLAVGGLVLLIASTNVAGMLLARAAARRREMHVRLALGAGRLRLVRQLLTESVLLFVLGATGGMLVAEWGTRALQGVPLPAEFAVSLDLVPDARVLGFALVLSLMTGLAFGLAPAMHGAGADLATRLRDDSPGGGTRRSRFRGWLISMQMSLSLLLLVAAGLFARSLDRGRRVDPGFDSTGVSVTALDTRTYGYDDARGRQFYAELSSRLATRPGVTDVAFARSLPLSGSRSGDDFFLGGGTVGTTNADGRINAFFAQVGNGYFPALRIPLVRGRGFAGSDGEHDAPVAVVNETFARTWYAGGDAIGHTVRRGNTVMTIVGVARDAKYGTLGEAALPFIYLPLEQHWSSSQQLIVRSTLAGEQVAAMIREEVRALDAGLPVPEVSTMSRVTSVVLLPQRVAAAITAAMGVVGLLLAAVGLYGVVAHAVSQRTREIGVRMALGAAQRDVVRMVLKEGLSTVIVGLGVGLVLAVIASRVLSPFLFGVSATDTITFVAVPVLLVAVAALASYLPARRAVGQDPMLALRQE